MQLINHLIYIEIINHILEVTNPLAPSSVQQILPTLITLIIMAITQELKDLQVVFIKVTIKVISRMFWNHKFHCLELSSTEIYPIEAMRNILWMERLYGGKWRSRKLVRLIGTALKGYKPNQIILIIIKKILIR